MSTWFSKHVEAWNKLIVKQILCIKLDNYKDKYTEMHGQQNIKTIAFVCRSLTKTSPCVLFAWATRMDSAMLSRDTGWNLIAIKTRQA